MKRYEALETKKTRFRDKLMQETVDLVVSKQDEKGQWCLENTFNPSFQINIEQKGKPSKWITLKVLTVLKNSTAIPQ